MTVSEPTTPGEPSAPSPIDRLVELAVFAPVGLALTARDELPALVEKGRRQVVGQLTVARMVGELALGRGQKLAERWTVSTLERLAAATEAAGAPSADRRSPRSTDDGDLAATNTRRGRGRGSTYPSTPGAANDTRGDILRLTPSPSRTGPDVAALAIPGYDSLSASQVVQRLPGLTADELDAVRAYEQAGRARKTILIRVAQLRAVS